MRLLKILTVPVILIFTVSLFAVNTYFSNKIVLIAKTRMNNLIRCYKTGSSGKKILLIGTVHGNEKAGLTTSINVLNKLFAEKILKNTLFCIPTANPDGNARNSRSNSNRVDINRNFPARNWVYRDSATFKDKKNYWGGNSPASETETKFILKVDSLYHPDVLIILHQFMDCVQYDGNGKQLAAFISARTGQKLLDDIGYKTEGSIGSYFGVDRNREVVTIEIPENPPDTLLQNIADAIIDAVKSGY